MLPAKISDIINNNVKIISKKFEKDFFGDAPAPFIGRFGYPKVNVGVLSAIDFKDKFNLDNPKSWAQKNTVEEIVNIRSSLINSRFKSNIYTKNEKLNELAKEIGLASKPVEVEINLKDKPNFKLNSDSVNMPRGPNAEMLKGKATSNAHIPTKVDKIVNDELKATEAVNTLYKKGIDENHLSQILSVGALGLDKNKKLVPTRWSITATDDIIGKELMEEVRQFPVLDHYELYFSGILGNHYLIMLLPEMWSYELFEMSLLHQNSYSTDYERFQNRKKYSEACEGGYYTVRLAVCEKLKQMKKQATAVVFRFITPDYTAPLGVWVTREASRKSLKSKKFSFSNKKQMVQMAKQIINDDFKFNLDKLSSKSVLLNDVQTSLMNFAK